MDSKALKELKALLRTLREQGVTRYATPELTLDLEALPPQSQAADAQSSASTEERELTEEELLFYSAPTPGTAVTES